MKKPRHSNLIGPAIALLILAFPPNGYECNTVFVMAMFCSGMFLNGALTSGHFAAPADLAPNYSGKLKLNMKT